MGGGGRQSGDHQLDVLLDVPVHLLRVEVPCGLYSVFYGLGSGMAVAYYADPVDAQKRSASILGIIYFLLEVPERSPKQHIPYLAAYRFFYLMPEKRVHGLGQAFAYLQGHVPDEPVADDYVLEKELTKYMKIPTVSVVVTAVNSFKVFVLAEGIGGAAAGGTTGGTSASGAVTLKRATTLLQLLAQLGSLQNGDLENSYVLRNGRKIDVDIHKLVVKGDISQDIQLRPNDIIFIADNFEKRIMVLGEVKTPRVIKYREGMTVLDAILSAGWFTQFANPNNVVVARKEGHEVRKIEVKLKDVINKGKISSDLPLKPGDRILVD